jgi:glycosyltransferase involved in cell wall biosynthesis
MLAAENWSFELCLGGEGSERNALEQLAAKLGLTERVSFLGHVVDVPALLARCHLMVHPSRREGLANAIIEGMAEGLPVIATAEAASEILEDLKTGLLVRADAPRELANAIRRLLVDADFRQRLGQAALAHARRVGGTVAIADAYEKIYLTFATGRIPAGRASAS